MGESGVEKQVLQIGDRLLLEINDRKYVNHERGIGLNDILRGEGSIILNLPESTCSVIRYKVSLERLASSWQSTYITRLLTQPAKIPQLVHQWYLRRRHRLGKIGSDLLRQRSNLYQSRR